MNTSDHSTGMASKAVANSADKESARIELAPPSFTMRVGKRSLTMSWRARKPMPVLLTGLLRRSWRAMFGRSLRISMTAAAICAAWNVPALAAAPPVNTLPTGGVITYGTATITQNGNTLNINQSTQQAIGNFTSFSIGANATVDISQPNSAAAFLARVTGTDPSLIYGLLKSNGTVALINQNGIMVGPGGVVDVARFIASTLKISDRDFLAGRLTFTAGTTAGNVDNQGTIKTGTGGSVYLIGANVSNSGVIQSPNGEILLAAGQTVQLIDTATPGVTVNVTGTAGSVTNLGTITAEAGRIGIAAGLINNSGNINASSVVSEGGRIFLRASQNLTTTASSNITADGVTKGGSVVLYSDKVAYLDGGISATGTAGQGGFIETSGKQSLDVVKLPTAGSGGTWLIDPYDLEVVASGGTGSGNVISSSGSVSNVDASVISGQLNAGTSVTLTTGTGGAANGGNITISSAINKTGGSGAGLTLNANNSIFINADITSTSGTLDLTLNSNLSGIAGDHTVNVSGALVKLNGGVLNVNDGSGNSGNGNIAIRSGATINLNQSGTLNAGTVTIATGGTLSSIFNAHVNLAGDLNNSGTVGINNSAISIGGKLLNQGTVNLANVSGTLGNVTNSGTMTMASVTQGIAATAFNNSGSLGLSNGSTLNAGAMTNSGTATINVSTLNVSTLTNSGTTAVVDGTLTATDKVTNAGAFTISNSTINTLNGFMNSLGATLNLNNQARFDNGGILKNTGTMNVFGSSTFNGDVTNDATGFINLGSDSSFVPIGGNGGWINNGVITLSGTSRTVQMTSATGMTNNGTVTLGGSSNLYLTTMLNNGNLVIGGSGSTFSATAAGGLTNAASGTITVGGDTSLNGTTLSNSGTLNMLGNSGVYFSTGITNEVGGLISGTGAIAINISGPRGTLVNNGTIAPGGDGVVGGLTIDGSYLQNATGVLSIDVASASSSDVLTINNSGGPQTAVLGGTLRSKFLNGYVPDSARAYTVISGGTISGYFRNVLGDIATNNGVKQMLKASMSSSNVVLTMSSGADLSFIGSSGANWGTASAWSLGYIPTAVDRVTLNGGTVIHSDGRDVIDQLTMVSGESLAISGGGLAVSTLSGNGTISVSGGNLALLGAARLRELNVSSGTVTGGVGSSLNVSEDFQQTGGTMTLADAALNQSTGGMAVGNITADNLVLESENGALTQSSGTALHVKKQLITSTATGTTLTNSGNQIAAFAANNRLSGDITLVNTINTADTTAVALDGISNTGGNVSVTNTGAALTRAIGSSADFLAGIPSQVASSAATKLGILGIDTTGGVKSSTGSISLVTHSPLTIGSGGLTAGGAITLAAGTLGSGLSTDTLVTNGVITSTGGAAVSLTAGKSIVINADINGLFSADPTPTYGPGVRINGILKGAPLPGNSTTSTTPTTSTTVTTSTTPDSGSSSQIDRAVNNSQPTSTSGGPDNTGSNPVSDNTQTTGGGAGNFGGDDSESENGQSTPAGGAKKAAKLYCS